MTTAKKASTKKPQLDPQRHCWISSEGLELPLKPIPPLILERITNDETGKPEPPMIEVTYGDGDHTRLESNPNDPDYLETLNKWKSARNSRMVRYCIIKGVDVEPPEKVLKELQEYFPGQDHKYLWIAGLIKSVDDVNSLVTAIVGQTTITEAGIEAASKRFPSDE